MAWQPTIIRRADQGFATAAETVRVTTDAGPGYLKALGNRGGPHRLAADWVGTQLARWLGLPTFDSWKDDQIYGLFPEFRPFLRPHWPALEQAVARLRILERPWVDRLIAGIPPEWEVDPAGRGALAILVQGRAHYMAETFLDRLATVLG